MQIECEITRIRVVRKFSDPNFLRFTLTVVSIDCGNCSGEYVETAGSLPNAVVLVTMATTRKGTPLVPYLFDCIVVSLSFWLLFLLPVFLLHVIYVLVGEPGAESRFTCVSSIGGGS